MYQDLEDWETLSDTPTISTLADDDTAREITNNINDISITAYADASQTAPVCNIDPTTAGTALPHSIWNSMRKTVPPSISTLGLASAYETTPVNPTPIPSMITLNHDSEAFIDASITSHNDTVDLPVGAFLSKIPYSELTGIDEKRTPAEQQGVRMRQLDEILESDDIQDDPLLQKLATNENLRHICFSQNIELTDIEKEMPAILLPNNDPVIQAFAAKHWHRIHPTKLEPAKIRPFLAWRPVNIIAKTLKHTTQLARMSIYHPLRKHIKARFPILNVPRLFEPVSAD